MLLVESGFLKKRSSAELDRETTEQHLETEQATVISEEFHARVRLS